MALFTAGSPITAEALNRATQRIVARGQRVSNSTGTTGNQPVMRIDDVPLWGGFTYRIEVNPVGLDVSGAADTPRINVYYTTDGSTPTSSSTQLGLSQTDAADAAVAESVGYWNLYTPVSDVVFSALLTVSKAVVSGGGNVTMIGGSGSTGAPIEFVIYNDGEDVGDTATEL